VIPPNAIYPEQELRPYRSKRGASLLHRTGALYFISYQKEFSGAGLLVPDGGSFGFFVQSLGIQSDPEFEVQPFEDLIPDIFFTLYMVVK